MGVIQPNNFALKLWNVSWIGNHRTLPDLLLVWLSKQRIAPSDGFRGSWTHLWIVVCPLAEAFLVQAKFRYAGFCLLSSALASDLHQASAPSKGPGMECQACLKIREQPSALYLFRGQMELKKVSIVNAINANKTRSTNSLIICKKKLTKLWG